jgi:signal transduction histidine kinase/CheY-like chemotaxis protein
MAITFLVALGVYTSFRLATGGFPNFVGPALCGLGAGLCLVTTVGLYMTRSVRWALFYGHSMAILFTVLTPVFAVFGPGVGVLAPDGSPSTYQFLTAPVVPPIIAFTLRDRTSLVGYTMCLMFSIMLATMVNHGDHDLTGTGPYFIIILMNLGVSMFVLSFFTEVADGFHEASDAALNRAKRARTEAKAERSANEAKTRFVSVMSHEIRNPLQAILLQLEMLQLTKLSASQSDYVAGLGRASNSLLAVVNEILEVTKIESGNLTLEVAPLSLRHLVETTLHSHASVAASRGIELVSSIPPTLDTGILGDATRIRQVLHNLVSNALKFTESGEVEVTLASEGELSDGQSMWTLAVRDTGIGIDKAGQRKLFREFSQVSDSTARLYGGTGLGLYICKEVTSAMGGSMAVESSPGLGSRFTASFAAQRSDTPDSLPVHMVTSTSTWSIVIFATNDALRHTLEQYVAYFFAGVNVVKVDLINRISSAESCVDAHLRRCNGQRRLIVVANHTDCTSGFLDLLEAGRCIPIMLSGLPPHSDADTLAADGWRNVVDKPVVLRKLCSTLERAIGPQATSGDSSTAASPSSSEARLLADGSVTEGSRLPSMGQMVEVAKVQRQLHPDVAAVLVIDDCDLTRSAVQTQISSLGFNTLVAANAEQGLKLLERFYDRIGMVLVDFDPQRIEGHKIPEQIRAFEKEVGISSADQVYICAMTGKALDDHGRKWLGSRCSRFLLKPVRDDDLKTLLRSCAEPLHERRGEPTQTVPSVRRKPRKRKGAKK